MRKLVGLAIVACLFWIGGTVLVTRAVSAVIDDRRANGFDITADQSPNLSPALMGTRLSALSARHTGGLMTLTADDIVIALRSFAPTTARVILNGATTFDGPTGSVAVTQGTLTGDMRVGLKPSAPVRMINLTSGAVGLSGDTMLTGWGALDAQAQEDTAGAYDIGAQWQDIALSPAILKQIDPSGATVPATIQSVSVDGRVTFDGSIALNDTDPRYMTKLTLADATVTWGGVQMMASGELTIDAAGIPQGVITVDIKGAAQVIDLMVATGAIDPAVSANYRTLITSMQRPDGTLSLPIGFRSGRMSVGFIPLGPAPVFR